MFLVEYLYSKLSSSTSFKWLQLTCLFLFWTVHTWVIQYYINHFKLVQAFCTVFHIIIPFKLLLWLCQNANCASSNLLHVSSLTFTGHFGFIFKIMFTTYIIRFSWSRALVFCCKFNIFNFALKYEYLRFFLTIQGLNIKEVKSTF